MEGLQHIVVVVIRLYIIYVDPHRIKPCLLDIGDTAIAIGRCKGIKMPLRIFHILIDAWKRDPGLKLCVRVRIRHIPQKACRRILLEHLSAHDHRIRIILAREETAHCVCVARVVKLLDRQIDPDCLLPLLLEVCLAIVHRGGQCTVHNNRDAILEDFMIIRLSGCRVA